MDRTDIGSRKAIAVYQAIFYSLFQAGMTALTVFVCLYQTARGKWGIMIAFSVSVSVDYVAQIVESVAFASDWGGQWLYILFMISSVGLFSAFILYLHLITSYLKPCLIRKRMFQTARIHIYSIAAPILVVAAHTLMTIYLIATGSIESSTPARSCLSALELLMHALIALISIWNLMLKRKYHKKYLKTRCYSWAIAMFFVFNASMSTIVAVEQDESFTMYSVTACVNLAIDLCPMIAFMYFALYSKNKTMEGNNGWGSPFDERTGSFLHNSPLQSHSFA